MEYVIVTDPKLTPVTIPLDDPTVAIEGLLLLQVPPGVTSAKVVVEPTQIVSVPVMALGDGVTVTGIVI